MRGENLLDCFTYAGPLHDPGWSSGRDGPSEVTTKWRCLEAEKVCWPCQACGQRGEWSGKMEWNGQRPGEAQYHWNVKAEGWKAGGSKHKTETQLQRTQ